MRSDLLWLLFFYAVGAAMGVVCGINIAHSDLAYHRGFHDGYWLRASQERPVVGPASDNTLICTYAALACHPIKKAKK